MVFQRKKHQDPAIRGKRSTSPGCQGSRKGQGEKSQERGRT
jgi:hypothetical protein